MKKNFILVAGLALLGFALFKKYNRKASPSPVGTTGTATRPPTDIWDALIGRASASAAGAANRVVYGSPGGGANGGDLTPLVKAGVGAAATGVSRAASWAWEKIFGGARRDVGTAPGTSAGYGSDPMSPIWDGTEWGIQNDQWYNTTYGTGMSTWSDLERARNESSWQLNEDETWSGNVGNVDDAISYSGDLV